MHLQKPLSIEMKRSLYCLPLRYFGVQSPPPALPPEPPYREHHVRKACVAWAALNCRIIIVSASLQLASSPNSWLVTVQPLADPIMTMRTYFIAPLRLLAQRSNDRDWPNWLGYRYVNCLPRAQRWPGEKTEVQREDFYRFY